MVLSKVFPLFDANEAEIVSGKLPRDITRDSSPNAETGISRQSSARERFRDVVNGRGEKMEMKRLGEEEPKVPSEYLLKCPHCEQVFSGPKAIHELKEHLANSHKEPGTKNANFPCQKCGAIFATKVNLAKHKQFHNTSRRGCKGVDDAALRKFPCELCEKAFKFKHHLKEHIRIHTKERPYVCVNCGKTFSHSGSFSSHNTSKKCFIVNLKVKTEVRKVDNRSTRGGRGGNNNNSFRPIIPKYRSGTSAGTSELAPILPASGYLPEQFPAGQFSSGRQQTAPYLPLSFHPLLGGQPHYQHLPAMGHFPEVTHLLQQRGYDSDADPHALSSHLTPSSSSNLTDRGVESSGATSPRPNGAVKKILEIVDATVTKQQKSPTTRPRNGLLSELLSAQPKSPQPLFTCDARCRFCSRLFDSRVDLHQHESYLCPELQKSPRNPHENGNKSEAEYCEDRRAASPSSLNVDCVLTLKAHYHNNPRPQKSELIRLSKDLKCSVRIVQEWFQLQSISNGALSPDSQQRFSNGHHSFQQMPHFNGVVPSDCGSNQIVPFRPIAERSPPRILDATTSSSVEEQPLDLSINKKMDDHRHQEQNNNDVLMSDCCDDEDQVLNLSQRCSRTVSSPCVHKSQPEPPSLHSSLLYKYMQLGTTLQQSLKRERSPTVEMPSSPERSQSQHAERPHGMSSPGGVSYVNNSSSPSCTTGSYCHTDEPGDGSLYSPSAKKARMWKQDEGDDITLDEGLGTEKESSRGSAKMRKSWKLHKVKSEEGMYACDLCDKMFNKQSSLARHKYEHSGQRPFKCDECWKAFKHKHHLTEHKRTHNGEKPFECEICLKRFSHSGSFSQHKKYRNNKCKLYNETEHT
ncbi:hypothetical protein JTE90_016715 [Oedothorax gibbosus]|uniref:C2H2-type domain-containing protein n=1 Tax=Oedothorax gibbosus TaxID=931172 RepID=A0AAV6V2A5_9ARAC|nr:hypothetical protein JTE90_016715 [Oedothorax gibbosus]